MPHTLMFTTGTHLTEFILQEGRTKNQATGSFTLLLVHIEHAAKTIASHIRKTGLVDIIGKTGKVNSSNEEVQKLDKFSNDLLTETLLNSGQVHAIASEELDEPVYATNHTGDYVVYFDPLDGSSNIDVNVNIGTIFSIYHKDSSLLQPGKKQVAAGYILYGSSVMFVYTSGAGVHGFTLDPSVGSFLLSHPNIRVPASGSIYSINEGNANLYDQKIRHYLDVIKNKEKPYKMRYIGSLVADVHRTLLKGGIFLYPADKKSPQGKLRLMFEINPMAFLMQQAGGEAISNGRNPLDIIPEGIHERVPIVLGSKTEVEYYSQITNS